MQYNDAFKLAVEYFEGDELAANVFLTKYALQGDNGDFLEPTPSDMHRRLAREFARIEAKYPNPMSEDEIFGYLDRFKYIVPQGSPMAGIGNPYQVMSLSNCFVIGGPEDSYAGIMMTDQEQAQLMKRRGGVGFDISKLRPKGMNTNNAAKTTDGIGIFMDRFSNTTREVAQGGRRGALMLTISVHHPEIETFIHIKNDPKRVTGANISIRLTDDFMNAVKNNEKYELRWPVDSDNPVVTEQADATEIWDKIITSAHASAEPGLLFWDTVKRRSATDDYEQFQTVSTNPCFPASEYLMTNGGLVTFGELYKTGEFNLVHADSRVSYEDDGGPEEPHKWKVSSDPMGTTNLRLGSPVQLTRKNAQIVKLTMKDGRTLRLTPDHKVATADRGMVEAQDLTSEDKILLGVPEPRFSVADRDPQTIEEIEAFIMGLVTGDGGIDKRGAIMIDLWSEDEWRVEAICSMIQILHDHYGPSIFDGMRSDAISVGVSRNESANKVRIRSLSLGRLLANKWGFTKETKHVIPAALMRIANSTSALFYLKGLFFCDGSFQGNNTSGYSARLHQSSPKLLAQIQLMLQMNGMLSKVYLRRQAGERTLPDGRGGSKLYNCKADYELIIGGAQFWKIFGSSIGFWSSHKDEKLTEIALTRPNYAMSHWTTMVSREDDGIEDVYCLKEDISRTIIVNGNTCSRCGEITLSEYDSCRLLLVNTLSFVENPFTPEASFDYAGFITVARKAQRLMDDMVDLELEQIDKTLAKIDADPEADHIKRTERELWEKIRWTCENGRRTGLGVTAVGDAVAAMGERYGSFESIRIVENIYASLTCAAYEESNVMAGERGPFPVWNFETEKNNEFITQIFNNLDATEAWRTTGRRNIACTTTAPAGSVSILTQTTSGIEPTFMTSYTRRKKINPSDKNAKVDFTDDLGDKWTEFTVYHPGFKRWMEVTGETDVKKSPYYKATANDIDWVAKVKAQAAAQRWIDHAISNTTNIPEDTDVETVKQIYMTGWESGCKGVTIYRDGSRSGVLVNPDSAAKLNNIITNDAPKRPEELDCTVHHMTVLGEKWMMFVGMLNGKPYELMGGLSKYVSVPKRVTHGKIVKHNGATNPARYDFHYDYEENPEDETIIRDLNNGFENATHAAFTRTISLALRHGAPVRYVVEQIQKGSEKEDEMFSFAKAASRVLKHYIEDGIKITGKSCQDCGSDALIYQEGCAKCTACGSSKCG